jgi:starch synthase (maltosyl-transferring)
MSPRRKSSAHPVTIAPLPEEGRTRAVIENVTPDVDGGRYPIKRTPGDIVIVEADVFADGHDKIAAVLRYRRAPGFERARSSKDDDWSEVPLVLVTNDRWRASFTVEEVGQYEYEVEAWVDRFASWRHGLEARVKAAQDVSSELLEGAALVRDAASRVKGEVRKSLSTVAKTMASSTPNVGRIAHALGEDLATRMSAVPDRRFATRSDIRRVTVDRERARFGAWYEMFPRSAGPDPTRSATFREAAERLPAIALMGFDVLYLAPIHPIGRTNRKGRGNTLAAQPSDPGSPWAIGAEEGGHTAIEPGLGTLEDFRWFREEAARHGLEVALDLAYQASPDHPYTKAHPDWFRRRPDGTLKYAENPPKKYQDIYPFDFETDVWRDLWIELRDIVLFWVDQGVRIFRVDNAHTMPLVFWEWLIADVQARDPNVLFLSEAFTRPKIMRHLAKLGFTQSYTYFTWRNTKKEIEEYFTELTTTELIEYFRPNLFANTPDILHEFLQAGGPPAFRIRLVLAATLGATYGIYSGYEICENRPAAPGSEEYLDSEKYQFRQWNWASPDDISELITKVNALRHEHLALQYNDGLRFHLTTMKDLVAYSKTAPGGGPRLLVVVSLSPDQARDGMVCVSIPEDMVPDDETYTVRDLLTDRTYTWVGGWNYVHRTPDAPAHIFLIDRVPRV